LLRANRTKKGYYIRRVKESLWSIFGFNRIKPFGDNFTKEEIKAWKTSKEVTAVYDDLYSPSVQDDPSSDTYAALIIRAVFPSDKELTQENAVWTQSVLETIFDVEYLSTKIDNDVIESWKNAIIDQVTS
jgi:hypothetical protein